MKLVINRCYGDFNLSDEALAYYNKLSNKNVIEDDIYTIKRNDPYLIQVVEYLGERANGYCAKLKVVEIPDDIEYQILYFDGIETVVDTKRMWT